MGCCFSQEETQQHHKQQSRSPLNPPSIIEANYRQSKNNTLSSEALKQKGNEHFKKKQFVQAIQAYRKAINLPNAHITNYSNLALAYKANGQYTESIKIVNQMNKKQNFKTYEHAQYLRKAQIIKSRCIIIQVRDYCLSANYTQKNTHQKLKQINQAVHNLQQITSVPNTNQQIQSYLQSGIKIKNFLQSEVLPRSKKQTLIQYLQIKCQNLKLQGTISHFYNSQQEILSQISSLVQKQMQIALLEPDQWIVDPITYDIFQSPVIVPSGQTYDESILKQHFKNNGYNDPITHEVFQIGQKVIVRNLNLQNYIHQIRKPVNKTDLDYLKY